VKEIKPENINRVVVRGTNWVGDAVMTIPALRELRRILPDAHITLCTRSWAKGIFADADFIDDILVYDKTGSAITNTFNQSKIWRTQKFDLAILFQNAFEAAVLSFLGRASYRIGYATERRNFLLTHAFQLPEWRNKRHEIFYYLNIIAELETLLYGSTKVFDNEPRFELKVSEERKEKAKLLLHACGADNERIVALCPGSTNSRAKRWQTESYAALGDMLIEKLNVGIALIGAKDEVDVSNEVASKMKYAPIFLTGKTSLDEAVSVLSVVDALVTNDTGPAHIAAALGKPTLVIFGPTIPETTRPFPSNAEIIYKPPDCAPCMLRDCPIDHRCMTAIKPEEVFEKMKTVLGL
jgi:heptosyltransferase-2